MLRQTVNRLGDVLPPERVFVITNAEQVDAVKEVCDNLPGENIIGEPVGRDTAAAVGLAWLLVKQRDPGAVFAMLPADHVIHDESGFRQVLRAAFDAARREEILVTIGITPTHAATGYGYIQTGSVRFAVDGTPVYQVQAFREKPDQATAEEYLKSGAYYWNAGMFVWSVNAIGNALQAHAAGLHESLANMQEDIDGGTSVDDAMARHYPTLEKISIDYAIMEKATNVAVIKSSFDWDDVGEWPAVSRHEETDADGNTTKGDTVLKHAEGNIVLSSRGHTTAVLGCKDLIIVTTADATLVCHKDEAQNLKNLVREIGEDRPELM